MQLDSIALAGDEVSLTYRQLVCAADESVRDLPGRCHVLFAADNTLESVMLYVGMLRNGVVPLVVRPGSPLSQLEELVRAYEPPFLVLDEPSADALLDEHPEYGSIAKRGGYRIVCTGHAPAPLHDDLALLLTTSGSTGTPKFVRLSYGNIRSNALQIAEYQALAPSDRAITTLPLSYSYGVSIVNSHLVSGASVFLTKEPVVSRTFWGQLAASCATNFGGVPYTYTMLERLRFERMDLPSLRFVSQAGGRLGERLHERFAEICRDKGIALFVMYGQTEATARMSYLAPELALDKVGSIGVAVPGGSFRLEGQSGEPVGIAAGEGELVFAGPNVCMGYAERVADLALGDVNEGVLRTGDIARCDNDGCYYITGRLSRFVKLFGNRVGLDGLEAMLARHGVVAACAGTDEKLTVYVEGCDEGAVKRLVLDETKLPSSAFSFVRIDALPRKESGKIDYAGLAR